MRSFKCNIKYLLYSTQCISGIALLILSCRSCKCRGYNTKADIQSLVLLIIKYLWTFDCLWLVPNKDYVFGLQEPRHRGRLREGVLQLDHKLVPNARLVLGQEDLLRLQQRPLRGHEIQLPRSREQPSIFWCQIWKCFCYLKSKGISSTKSLIL